MWNQHGRSLYGIAAYQPLRVDRGRMELLNSTGYASNDALGYDGHTLSLAPNGRQRNIEFFLRYDLMHLGQIKTSFQYMNDAGHQQDEKDVRWLFAWQNGL